MTEKKKSTTVVIIKIRPAVKGQDVVAIRHYASIPFVSIRV